MEIRASYALVGLFTLLTILGLIGFTLWSSAKTDKAGMIQYEVAFNGSVSGLSLGNDALFNGVRVGQVRTIRLNPHDPSQVRVFIEIADDTPVRTDSVAKLEARGMTGLAVVSISGGSATSPLLHDDKSNKIAVIQSISSPLELFLDSAPKLLSSATDAMEDLKRILGAENQGSINKILGSAAELTETIAKRSNSLDNMMLNMEKTSKELDQFSSNLNKLSSSELKETVVEMHKLVKTMNSILSEPSIAKFAKEGLDDSRRAISEARLLINTLNRVALKLESDPSRFFFGSTLPEYSTKK